MAQMNRECPQPVPRLSVWSLTCRNGEQWDDGMPPSIPLCLWTLLQRAASTVVHLSTHQRSTSNVAGLTQWKGTFSMQCPKLETKQE